jgi:RNA polymerase sigma-70 factor (ECF subfamily)
MSSQYPYGELARGIKYSDTTAFRRLFESTNQLIFNFLYYRLGNVEAAEDILQEVFVKLWEKRDQINEHMSIKSYLMTIAHNLAANWVRHNHVVMRFQLEQANEHPMSENPYLEYEFRETQNLLTEALAGLPNQPRIVFMMSRFEGLKYQEIAERLGLSVKTVESHMVKALKMLRESLQVAA